MSSPMIEAAGLRKRFGETVALDRFELTDAADRMVKTYSGGMRRRLDLAASLVAARRFRARTTD